MLQQLTAQYNIGVCTQCFQIEVVGPGRESCLVCGKPFTHGLALQELQQLPAAAAPPATVYHDEIPEDLELRGACPYCTGALVVRVSEADYAIEADVAAVNGAESAPAAGDYEAPGAASSEDIPVAAAELLQPGYPETERQAAAADPGGGEESVTTPEAAPEPA